MYIHKRLQQPRHPQTKNTAEAVWPTTMWLGVVVAEAPGSLNAILKGDESCVLSAALAPHVADVVRSGFRSLQDAESLDRLLDLETLRRLEPAALAPHAADRGDGTCRGSALRWRRARRRAPPGGGARRAGARRAGVAHKGWPTDSQSALHTSNTRTSRQRCTQIRHRSAVVQIGKKQVDTTGLQPHM